MRAFVNNTTRLVFLYFFIAANVVMAQQQTNGFRSQVRFGGSIGLSFGDGYFSGTIAPSAVYEFNKSFALGLAGQKHYKKLGFYLKIMHL